MHACLLIPEILRHIFSDIYLSGTDGGLQVYWEGKNLPIIPPDRQVARRSLAALSRVCLSFRDIALDVLWSELDNLEPLFTCLPRSLWAIVGPGRRLVILRSVTTADWSVFHRYASRVRVLGDRRPNIFGSTGAEFVHSIMGFSSQSLLVPNLRALYYRAPPRDSDMHLCLRYLLGSSLVCLFLAGTIDGSWTNITSSVLSGLSRYSPRLRIITLVDMPSHVNELALCGLSHLQEVSLVLVGDKAFQFRTPTLDLLRIRLSTLTLCRSIVEKWVVPCRRMCLVSKEPETALGIERALCKLNNRILCDGLEEFRLHVLRNIDHIDYAFSLPTFIPLMRFSSLKIVNLGHFCVSLLDDNALGAVVKSWPHLECLYLGTTYFYQTPPKITFNGLVTVLSSCLNLKNLGLVFDTTKLDPPTAEKLGGGVYNTNITTLRVGVSPIERPQQVAVSLSAILPCLIQILVEFEGQRAPDHDAREEKWEEVTECIGIYTLVRKQEGFRV